jgi:hypothetical protein
MSVYLRERGKTIIDDTFCSNARNGNRVEPDDEPGTSEGTAGSSSNQPKPIEFVQVSYVNNI